MDSADVVSLLASGVALLSSLIAYRKASSHDVAVRRLESIEESVVRSVMEEEDDSYAKAVLETAERMSKHGMRMADAVLKAQELHRSQELLRRR